MNIGLAIPQRLELGMRRDGEDRDYVLAGTVVPEDAIGGRRGLLGVGLEDLLAARSGQAPKLVGLQARMSRIGF